MYVHIFIERGPRMVDENKGKKEGTHTHETKESISQINIVSGDRCKKK